MGVIQGPPCGQVVTCVTKVFSLKIASSPIRPFLEHEERPSKSATYMVWDHQADSDGWVGGRWALIGPSVDFLPSGPVGKGVGGIAKTGPRAGGQKMQYCQGRGTPPSGK